MILIFVSFESNEDAERTANYLLDNKLAACIEIFPVKNYYIWEGKKQKNDEFTGIIKTDNEFFSKVEKALKEILPYEIPQIIEIKTSNINESYLKWVKKTLEIEN